MQMTLFYGSEVNITNVFNMDPGDSRLMQFSRFGFIELHKL